MKKRKKKNKPKDYIDMYDVYKKVRKSWGDVNPVTKIVPDKKKYTRKKKHKRRYEDDN